MMFVYLLFALATFLSLSFVVLAIIAAKWKSEGLGAACFGLLMLIVVCVIMGSKAYEEDGKHQTPGTTERK